MINIDLPIDRVAALLLAMKGATATVTTSRVTLEWDDETSLEARDASPDAGTDITVYDLTERRGWRVFDYLVDRTLENLWMMDAGGLLLSARGVTPEELGLELATNRVPEAVICFGDDGEPYEWSPLKSKRDGVLVEEPGR
jgi:hypothetical protein